MLEGELDTFISVMQILTWYEILVISIKMYYVHQEPCPRKS